jgi:hypothetical protein
MLIGVLSITGVPVRGIASQLHRSVYKLTTFITYEENTSTVFSKYIDFNVTLSQRLIYPISNLSVNEGSKSGLPLKLLILLETLGVGSKTSSRSR